MPGPLLRATTSITPRTHRGADNVIYIDPVIEISYEIPFSATSTRFSVGQPVYVRGGSVAGASICNPISVTDASAVRDARLSSLGPVTGTPATTDVFLGFTVRDVEAGEMGVAAGVGSVLVVKCDDASVDTALGTPGNFVVASSTGTGTVEGLVTANLQAAGGALAGLVIGRIIIGAGTAAGKTGSNTSVCIKVLDF